MVLIKKDSLPTIKKAAGAIHISSNGLRSIHKRTINAFIYIVRQKIESESVKVGLPMGDYLNSLGKEEIDYSFPYDEFKSIVDFDSNNQEYINEVLNALMDVYIDWDLVNERLSGDSPSSQRRKRKRADWSRMQLLTFGEVRNNTITFSFRSEVRNLLANPQVFAAIDLNVVESLKNHSDAHSLYENTYRYISIGTSPWIDIDTLRLLLGKTHSHIAFKDFHRDVVKKSVGIINKRSDMELSYEYEKRADKKQYFKFYMSKKASAKADAFGTEVDSLEASEIEKMLLSLGLRKQQISTLFDRFDVKYLMQNTLAVIDIINNTTGIKKPAAYAYRCLIDDSVYIAPPTPNPTVSSVDAEPSVTATNSSGQKKLSFVEIQKKFDAEFMTLMSNEFDAYRCKMGIILDVNTPEGNAEFQRYVEGAVFMRPSLSEKFLKDS